MADDDVREPDSATARAVISHVVANSGDADISEIMSAIKFYSTMRPEVRKFFYDAKPETLVWLTNVRADEIDLLDDGIRLVQSSKTVGRFVKWALLTLFGALIVGSQGGEAIMKLFGWFKGK